MAYGPKVLTNQPADFDAIRALLGVSETTVPDATIEATPFLPAVESEVTAVIIDYATLSGDNATRLKAGVQAYVAALLCGHIERCEGSAFRIGQFEEKAGSVDWKAKAVDLMRLAAGYLGAITTRTWSRRTAIALAGPSRSGARVPSEMEQWIERITPRIVDWIAEGGDEDDSWHDAP